MFEKYAVLSVLFQGFVVGVLPVEIWTLADTERQKFYLTSMAEGYCQIHQQSLSIDIRSVNVNDNLYFIARRK